MQKHISAQCLMFTLDCQWSYHYSEQIWWSILSERNSKLINVLTFLQGQSKFSIDFRKVPRISEQKWNHLYKFWRTRPSGVWRSQTEEPSSSCSRLWPSPPKVWLCSHSKGHMRLRRLHKAPLGHTRTTEPPFYLPIAAGEILGRPKRNGMSTQRTYSRHSINAN